MQKKIKEKIKIRKSMKQQMLGAVHTHTHTHTHTGSNLKNRKKIVCVGILAILIIFALLVIYSENMKEISIIKNVKRAFGEAEQSSNSDIQNNVTTIDVTSIIMGKKPEHEHIYKTKYDKDKHWEECNFCGITRNEENHTKQINWKLGYESCEPKNSYVAICSCGYSENGHRPCVWRGEYFCSSYLHVKVCSVCGNNIERKYYYNEYYGNGGLYTSFGFERCQMSNGRPLNCKDIGKKCYICGYVSLQNPEHFLKVDENTERIYCEYCNKTYGICNYKLTKSSSVPVEYIMTSNFKLTNGALLYNDYDSLWKIDDTENVLDKNGYEVINRNSEGTEFTIVQKIRSSLLKKTTEIKCPWWGHLWIEGNCEIDITDNYIIYNPDFEKPKITNISIENNNEWSKYKTITVKGTENWTDEVNVEILDDKENIIYQGKCNVTNKNYSISFIPEIEVGLNGKKFKVIVTDACDNSTEQEFTIAKVDAYAPEITSGNELGGDWAKEKKFIFTAIDYGCENVQIAFNDMKDYQLATKKEENYSREYEFIGDVYKPTNAIVYYKDELGNVSSKKIILDKLDNTAPSITNAELHNSTLKITAHDRHETLGEGSGVTKYRYLASTEKIENPELTESNSTEINKNDEIKINEIYKIKYVYLIAEDYVGNISKVYEFEVPQLIITSKVNLNSNEGKGAVELDWASYDITDKYFVIYRKKENETDWKKIVNIEEKFNENTYTDILANDIAKPNTPNITITGEVEDSNINITSTATDNESIYQYYIESYDSTTNTLLNISKTIKSENFLP